MSARPLRLAIAIGLAACRPADTRTPNQPTPVSGDPAGTPVGDAKADGAPKCRDWSTLDRKTLPPLPASAHTALLEQVWGLVLEKHYDPTLACKDWPALRVRYGERVAAAKSDDEAYAAINAMLAELGQSHLGLIPPRRAAAAEPGEARPVGRGRVPLELVVLGDEVVISDPAWQGKSSKLPAGATIVKIDDHDVGAFVREAGTTWPRKVERDFRVLRAAYAWLSCNPGEKRKVTFLKGPKHNPATVGIACHAPALRTLSFGNLHDVPVEVRAAMVPGSEVGVVYWNVWLLPLADEIGSAVADLRAKGMKHLVIDLRGNPGGIGLMVVPVARLLLDQDADLGVMHMREGEQRFAVKRGGDPFRGKVAILVDEGTGSTSEIFAQALRDLGRAIVVGASASQGAALPSLIEKLDGGAMLQYVVADYESPAGTAVEGKGVAPDVLVEIKREDLRAGRDPVMDAAVEALK